MDYIYILANVYNCIKFQDNGSTIFAVRQYLLKNIKGMIKYE